MNKGLLVCPVKDDKEQIDKGRIIPDLLRTALANGGDSIGQVRLLDSEQPVVGILYCADSMQQF